MKTTKCPFCRWQVYLWFILENGYCPKCNTPIRRSEMDWNIDHITWQYCPKCKSGSWHEVGHLNGEKKDSSLCLKCYLFKEVDDVPKKEG